jgi:hypothetical protein
MMLSLLPQFSMSRVYTLTVMVTLLARKPMRDALGNKTYHSIKTAMITDRQSKEPASVRVSSVVGVPLKLLTKSVRSGWYNEDRRN